MSTTLPYTLLATVISLLLCATPLAAQSPHWQLLSAPQLPTGERRLTPTAFTAATLVDTAAFRQLLWSAPHERSTDVRQSPVVVELLDPTGQVATFRLVAYDLMDPALAARFPGIRSWRGVDRRDPRITIHLDWTARGLHAAVRGGGQRSWFVDPYLWNDSRFYQSYFTDDYPAPAEPWTCHTEAPATKDPLVGNTEKAGDCRFRSYRTAIATTAEYSNFFGATDGNNPLHVALVHSAIVTSLNRVNQVYATDLAIRLILVANNDLIYYYDAATDPYTNGNGGAMLNENQANLDLVIGADNYDMGHVFSTGGGGVAQLNSPCRSGKARGVTGRNQPVGDPFDIDYVAHEMGHQFGANHTQNNGCNYNANAGMEPGSASTIMGYAGICSPNVQNNSDDYFHGISIQEIANYMENGSGNSCATTLSLANDNPTISQPTPDRTIPAGTPFVLTANAADPNGHPLVYCWEQWDPEQGTHPPMAANTLGPLFRSLVPTGSPQRYFLNLDALVNNTNPTWEELPGVSRSMEFRATIRDWDATNGYGCTTEDNVLLDVAGSSGPFQVTNPNTALTWTAGQSVAVSWDVAGTNQAPVACAAVDLLLSLDGGYTYPITLATGVANTGLAYVAAPDNLTTQARVMVRCSDNIFFDLSNTNFTISAGVPTFNLTTPIGLVEICEGSNTAAYNLAVGSFLGYTDPVSLAVTAAPAGVSASLNPAVAIPGSSALLELSNLAGLVAGDYTVQVTGTAGVGSQVVELILRVLGRPNQPGLQSPASGSTDQPLAINLSWQAAAGSPTYELQLATDPTFAALTTATTLTTTSFQATNLAPQTTYYWRLRILSNCGPGDWSATFTFATVSCRLYTSTDLPQAIDDGPPSTINSTLDIADAGNVIFLEVVDISGEHTWTGDLTFSLISPAATSCVLVNGACRDNNDFLFSVSDSATEPATANCPLSQGLTYTPIQSLSIFQQTSITGTWTLRVADNANQDGGSLNGWGIRVCPANFLPLPVLWLHFTAKPQAGHILLDWATAQEQHNLGFDIERRAEHETTWTTLAFVAGRGESQVTTDYTYADNRVRPGIRYYYRLRQVDFDGAHQYSEIRLAQLPGAEPMAWVFPNPTTAECTVNTHFTEPVYYQLFDLRGQQVQSGMLAGPASQVDLGGLPPGVYQLSITAPQGQPVVLRVVKTP